MPNKLDGQPWEHDTWHVKDSVLEHRAELERAADRIRVIEDALDRHGRKLDDLFDQEEPCTKWGLSVDRDIRRLEGSIEDLKTQFQDEVRAAAEEVQAAGGPLEARLATVEERLQRLDEVVTDLLEVVTDLLEDPESRGLGTTRSRLDGARRARILAEARLLNAEARQIEAQLESSVPTGGTEGTPEGTS